MLVDVNDFPLGKAYFQGLLLLVLGRVTTLSTTIEIPQPNLWLQSAFFYHPQEPKQRENIPS